MKYHYGNSFTDIFLPIAIMFLTVGFAIISIPGFLDGDPMRDTQYYLSMTDPFSDAGKTATDSEPQTEPYTEPQTESRNNSSDDIALYVDGMTLEQQVAQMFFARCPSAGAIEQIKEYSPGGYILFAGDFKNQTPQSLRKTLREYQEASSYPMLIGVDEEGGTVVRASKYTAFRNTPFSSPAEIYAQGGLDALIDDTCEKDAFLKSLGINVNLSPVCDVSTNPEDYIYKRSLGKDAKETSKCINAIVGRMTSDGMGAVLKHFPGYGSNPDTHTEIVVDGRSYNDLKQNDFLPFIAGIGAGAGSIMVSHNIMTGIDPSFPASLSPSVHGIIRYELRFDGVIMTDDLSMSAITKYTDGQDAAVSAVLAGNDMLISSDFVNQYNAVLSAVKSGKITKAQIRSHVIRIINWKKELGLIRF